MDCRTAQALFAFFRPGSAELEPQDRTALEAHVAECPDCDSTTRPQREADQLLGRAIRAVPVPDGLRSRIVARLDEERTLRQRRRVLYTLGMAAPVAAALLLALWGLSWLNTAEVNPEAFLKSAVVQVLPHAEKMKEIEDDFLRQGVSVRVPARFDYNQIAFWQVVEFQGKRTPQLVFLHHSPQGVVSARVYILSARKFNLNGLQKPDPAGSDVFNVVVWKHPDDPQVEPGFAYLIIYSGDSLRPFLAPDEPTI